MPASCFEARSYVLKNATVPVSVVADPHSGDLEKLDLTISDGGITKIEPAGSGDPGLAAHDCDGGLVLPAFVDTHTHLDKGHMWPRTANPDGSWLAALNACRMDHARELPPEDIVRRMDFALRSAFAHGTAAIRTHLDSVPPRTETVWQVFDEIRERWAGRIELQAVSLIGTDQMLEPEILDFVAKRTLASSGIMGGSVAVHPEARKAVFAAVEKAGNLGLDLDFHCDETGDPEANALRHLADAIIETGFPGKAVAGHCCVLAVQDAAWAQTTIERAVEAGIGIVSLPMCNMFLQDRWTGAGVRTPRWRGPTLLNELKAAGAKVAIASDNTRDPFYAYGDLDGLEVLREGARILHFDYPQDRAFAWVRAIGADASQLTAMRYNATIAPGNDADLVLVKARNWTELMARPQADRIVLRAGKSIDRTLPDYRELDDLMGGD